jgi:hypothetical protein
VLAHLRESLMTRNMKKIAVLTSQGEETGMTAAARAIVRNGIETDWKLLRLRRLCRASPDDKFR